MLIQIFLDNLMIIGPKTTKVPIIEINVMFKFNLKNRWLITNAATANAIPTP